MSRTAQAVAAPNGPYRALVRRILAIKGSMTTVSLFEEAQLIYGSKAASINFLKQRVLAPMKQEQEVIVSSNHTDIMKRCKDVREEMQQEHDAMSPEQRVTLAMKALRGIHLAKAAPSRQQIRMRRGPLPEAVFMWRLNTTKEQIEALKKLGLPTRQELEGIEEEVKAKLPMSTGESHLPPWQTSNFRSQTGE